MTAQQLALDAFKVQAGVTLAVADEVMTAAKAGPVEISRFAKVLDHYKASIALARGLNTLAPDCDMETQIKAAERSLADGNRRLAALEHKAKASQTRGVLQ